MLTELDPPLGMHAIHVVETKSGEDLFKEENR
jgi:hypothetical protein